jgi:hypothetical protein
MKKILFILSLWLIAISSFAAPATYRGIFYGTGQQTNLSVTTHLYGTGDHLTGLTNFNYDDLPYLSAGTNLYLESLGSGIHKTNRLNVSLTAANISGQFPVLFVSNNTASVSIDIRNSGGTANKRWWDLSSENAAFFLYGFDDNGTQEAVAKFERGGIVTANSFVGGGSGLTNLNLGSATNLNVTGSTNIVPSNVTYFPLPTGSPAEIKFGAGTNFVYAITSGKNYIVSAHVSLDLTNAASGDLVQLQIVNTNLATAIGIATYEVRLSSSTNSYFPMDIPMLFYHATGNHSLVLEAVNYGGTRGTIHSDDLGRLTVIALP